MRIVHLSDRLLKYLHFKALLLVMFMIIMQLSQPLVCCTSNTNNLPELNLSQTVNMRVVFLGIPSEYIDNESFVARVPQKINQFAEPNTISWTLNVSTIFQTFPESVLNSLTNNSFYFEETTYYNITLLDELLIQSGMLSVPNHGYLLVFMWLPDNNSDHSWFYVQERPDLFLGRTDYFNGEEMNFWAFPQNFGGIHRAIYFDISKIMEMNLTKQMTTNFVVNLFENCLGDIFPNLLGSQDSRWIEADMQRYENYTLKILWFNGTEEVLYPDRIRDSFEDLMPWTNWSIEIDTKQMDSSLNSILESQTEDLSEPLTYSFSLSNGSNFNVYAWRNLNWTLYDENDPINQYFFKHVHDYFNLTDTEDKSVIPIVFLQLENDTAVSGIAGMGAGVSWFIHNVIIIAFQGSLVTAMKGSGSIILTNLLRHELGHWVSLSHHSSEFGDLYPKIICSMRSLTNKFCAFCKDARARMSFISYYKATSDLLSDVQINDSEIYDTLENALQLFYDWNYTSALNEIISIYHYAEENKMDLFPFYYDLKYILIGTTVIVCILGLAIFLRKRFNHE